MPWDDDNDDDLDWFEKHLTSRMRFCFDLKRGMSRPMADHIRTLLTEARYIHSRQELLQDELEESDIEDIDTSSKYFLIGHGLFLYKTGLLERNCQPYISIARYRPKQYQQSDEAPFANGGH